MNKITEHDQQQHKFEKHPDFDPNRFLNNIAIMTLSNDVTLSEYVQVACLPTSTSTSYPPVNSAVWNVGWGSFSMNGQMSSSLMNMRVNALDPTKCNFILPTDWNAQMCSGNTQTGDLSQCLGDQASMQYVVDKFGTTKYKFALVGLFSYGHSCSTGGRNGYTFQFYLYPH